MQNSPQWEKIGFKEHNGINVPLFSIYSNLSCGIGEFPDLIPLISWCKEVSFDVIQLLPLNDTGPETSPYSAISAFALNPIHLGLTNLPFALADKSLKPLIHGMQKLNQLKRCDYPAIHRLKNAFLRQYYAFYGRRLMESDEYKLFKNENAWLESYALFKTLRIAHNWKSFEDFPPKLVTPTLLTYQELLNTHKEEISFHIFVQYLCFTQFEEVRKIAKKEAILLMGDIPILINRNSADVWMQRNLFKMDFSAGAPPDQYAAEGQNWGFPIFNWEEMEKEDYEWWKMRLQVASKLYDIYRIDHILGFFHIWSIPHSGQAHYIPQDSTTALLQGEKILNALLNASNMLPIGEDLGNVSNEIRAIMKKLLIPGTKVMRWERYWNEDKRFIDPKDYPPLSLTTVSTHDSETLALWWLNKSEEAKDYAKSVNFNYESSITREQQFAILKASLHTASVFHINLLQEYLSLIKGFTSDNISEEQINVPGTISNKNWTYRFSKPVEEIVKSEELKQLIHKLLEK